MIHNSFFYSFSSVCLGDAPIRQPPLGGSPFLPSLKDLHLWREGHPGVEREEGVVAAGMAQPRQIGARRASGKGIADKEAGVAKRNIKVGIAAGYGVK